MSGGRTEEQRTRKREREADKRIGRMNALQPALGPSIMELIWEDLDNATRRYLDLVEEGYGKGDPEVAKARGEMIGIARTIGRFGWAGNSYYPVRGMKNAIRASLARVREEGNEDE